VSRDEELPRPSGSRTRLGLRIFTTTSGSTIGTSRPEGALLNRSTIRPHPSSRSRSRGAKISRFPYQRCTERCRRVPTSLCGSEPNHRLTLS